MSGVNNPYRYFYEHVAAGQTAQVLGTTGAVGDYLHRIVCTVTTGATGNVVVVDGSGAGILTHTVVPASASLVPGVYNVELNVVSANGAWKITTGAGVEVMAVGIFTA
jgi:methionine-rich copper-binding protein CopC